MKYGGSGEALAGGASGRQSAGVGAVGVLGASRMDRLNVGGVRCLARGKPPAGACSTASVGVSQEEPPQVGFLPGAARFCYAL
jgi:hypothetical protein